MARHKLVVAMMLLLTTSAAIGVHTPPQLVHESSGSIVLLEPPDRLTVNGTDANPTLGDSGVTSYDNPWARYDDLTDVIGILSRISQRTEMRDRLLAKGVTAYTVAPDSAYSRSPSNEMTATGSSAGTSQDATDVVIAELRQTLTTKQTEFAINGEYYMWSDTVEEPGLGTASLTGPLRL